ncbi:MAG TPA: hypothetical protein VE089_08440 [Nitrososphaeraceae archaeon]|nr:hypothetical protein [Nitrososphaeraceae archaeon]
MTNNRQITVDQKQSRKKLRCTEELIVDDWLIEQFRTKLKKASIIAERKNRPFILYNNVIEESEHAVEEEVITVGRKYVIMQTISYGGFIPVNIQKQQIFTLDKFSLWIMKESRDTLLQCFNNLVHLD